MTVIEREASPLALTLGTRVGDAIADRHRVAGVEIEASSSVAGWLGDERLQGVQLHDGRRIEADLAVVGVGANPNVAWLGEEPFAGREGVRCDSTLAALAPGVVAAGDVVRWRHPAVGETIRLEHYEHAELSGAHAARRLLYGPDAGTYEPTPTIWSHQGPHTIHVAGFPSPEAHVDIVEGDLAAGPFAVTYSRRGVVGVLAYDLPRTYRRLRRELSLEGAIA